MNPFFLLASEISLRHKSKTPVIIDISNSRHFTTVGTKCDTDNACDHCWN